MLMTSVHPKDYRNMIGMFATGVTVVTSGIGDDVHAMTANAITSVSLEPAMLLFCVKKDARMVTQLEQHPTFTINILRQNQQSIADYFAGRDRGAIPDFCLTPWDGGIRLASGAAAIGCQVRHLYEGGDHWIVVGEVVALHQEQHPDNPLIFYRGQYEAITNIE